MMWGKTKKRQDVDANQAKDRLVSMLGLDPDEHEPASELASRMPFEILTEPAPATASSKRTPAEVFEPAAVDPSAIETDLDSAGIAALSAAVRALPERLAQKTEEALMGTPMEAPSPTAGAPQVPVPLEDLRRIVADELAGLSEKSDQLLDGQAKLFEEKLAGVANRALSQSEASVHRTVSRLEAFFSEAKQIESTMGESVANLAREATEALHQQNKILQTDLSQLASLIESQVTVGLEPVTGRIQNYRAQAEEVSSELEARLTRFAQKTAEAGLAQTQLFEEKIAAISEKAVSEAQITVEHRMAQLRETAMRSLEDEIASLSARLERSHLESFERRLDEMFEAAKAKIAVVQQESSNFSADLLSQMRTESEAIARDFHERLQLDAHALSANLMVRMRTRLQKLTDEFRSIFDSAAQG
jgi:hypothetical protein